jgi:hypothetical protein
MGFLGLNCSRLAFATVWGKAFSALDNEKFHMAVFGG